MESTSKGGIFRPRLTKAYILWSSTLLTVAWPLWCDMRGTVEDLLRGCPNASLVVSSRNQALSLKVGPFGPPQSGVQSVGR